MMRAVRDGMILSPPLTYTRDDIDATVAIGRTALDATAGDLESLSKVIAKGIYGPCWPDGGRMTINIKEWLQEKSVTEVECLVSDISGIP